MTVAEKIPTLLASEKSSGREEWLSAVDTLIAEVTEWSHLQGWRTVAREKLIIDETTQQQYTTLVLDIITEPGYSGLCREVKLVVEPMFFDAARKISRVDFSVWPTLYDVVLVYETSRHDWRLRGDSRFQWPSPWNQKSFVTIAEKLLEMGR